MVGIGDIVAKALGPLSDIIDNVTTTREEKDAMKIELVKAQGALESDFHQAQASVIIAEATGASWLQRNHRPLTVLTFVFIVAWNFVLGPIGSWLAALFGSAAVFPVLILPTGLWATISLGMGGYMALRTYEKTTLGKEPKFTKRQLKKLIKAMGDDE
jgi:uncharacterized protein YneF (UPF0154 family)